MSEPKYTAADLAEAFQAGLKLGHKAGERNDGHYAEGFLDGAAAARKACAEADDTAPADAELETPEPGVDVPALGREGGQR